MKKVKNFINEAEKLIDENDTLWLSFQTNSTSDLAATRKSFNIHLQALKEELKQRKFVLPSFLTNMRNSQPISSITVNDEGVPGYRMNGEINKLTSTVTGERPSLILINKKDADQELGNAIKNVIDKEYDLQDTKNLVVLYQGGSFGNITFEFNEIEKVLKTITTKHVNVFDPENLDDQTCENNLIHFLSNDDQILLVEQRLFTGCESPHIVYLISDTETESMRCALFRAVSHLSVILTINNDTSNYLNLKGLKLESKYLKCVRQSKYTFHCESCNIKNVCKCCLFFCHNQHQIEKGYFEDRKKIRCECNNTNCCKISSRNVTGNDSKCCFIL